MLAYLVHRLISAVTTIFIEGTGYYDWRYGLRRLFRQGSRPQFVVVGLEVNTSFENSVREEYVPMLLFSPGGGPKPP